MTHTSRLNRHHPWHRLIAARRNLTWHAMDGICLDEIPLTAIAANHGTPTWIYSAKTINNRLTQLQNAFTTENLTPAIRYAIKANDHLAILTQLRHAGIGADVTSHGEFARARAGGIAPRDMVYSGVGKRTDEIAAAITAGIGQLNVESPEELAIIAAIATGLGLTARIALRINPDIEAGGHDKISTGRATDKFGIPLDQAASLYRHAATLPGIQPIGFSTHIGSQIFDLTAFESSYTKILTLIDTLTAEGHPLKIFDLGGGFGIPYDDGIAFPLPAYAAMVRRLIADRKLNLIIEPGRWLVAPAGVLLARVTLTRQTEAAHFTILDAGMNDLLRPALYEAHHGIVPVSAIDATKPPIPTEIVGPVCESSDRFGSYALPALAPGALVAILDAGAYGAAMSSTYNGRPLAAQILIDHGQPHLIRMRQPVERLWRDEIIP